jgi:hypothetical protein
MEDKIYAEIMKIIRADLFEMVLWTAVIFFLVTYAKTLIETLVSYFQFRFNSNISTLNYVEVDGYIGKIVKIGMFSILIETDDGFYRVEMNKWKDSNWFFVKTDCSSYKNKKHDERHCHIHQEESE